MPTFQRLGRSRQLRLESAEDLEQVVTLDDALWVATAAPIDTLRLDPVFLQSIDSDIDGRVRSDELRDAIRWLLATIGDRAAITEGRSVLSLASIDPTSADGPAILDAARRILGELGQPGAPTLQLQGVRRIRAAEEARGLSAAGKVLLAAAGDDPALAAFLDHVLETTGGEPHPSGERAVTAAALAQFLAEGRAWLAWHDEPTRDPAILPLGDGTAVGAAATDAVAAKLQQYFLLCDAVALDPSIEDRVWISHDVDLLDPAAAAAALDKAPIARPRADGVLDLTGPINPAWRDRLSTFGDRAVRLIVGARTSLDRAAVAAVRAKLAPYGAWTARKPGTRVGERGVEVLRAHVTEPALADAVRRLLVESESAAVALDGVKLVEKTLLYQQNLMRLANTLVAMPELFDPTRNAAFERGTLVMDGRVFKLAIPVNDPARAERFAAMSPMYVLFVKVGEKGSELSEEVMVPVTAGDQGHLVEGMWGVFHAVDGRLEHAQVRKIAVAPISIREALLLPFVRLADTLQGMFDQAAVTQQIAVKNLGSPKPKALDGEAPAGAPVTPPVAPPPQAAPQAAPAAPSSPSSSAFGQLPLLVAGAGVALGAVGTVVVQAMDMFMNAAGDLAKALIELPFMGALPASAQSMLSVVALPVAVLLVMLGLVTVPALMYLIPVATSAWLRLRRRDLATLLEGSGWAINTRLYLDVRLAGHLTRRPRPV